ncbi:bacteriocin immunity protein [Companilactobacillus sp. HBUAS56275]|jgi:Enterocin A Immunity.|uniref:Bacteriocin immunity protein n=1 Tax=Candidatus Companilactobacillus pullicola TaxID=2838523 RepID=A0A9D1ZPM4_9LACO|nr:bacteriocin immunity protein [Candidatus Companilactobacillus pullicola]
MNANTEELMKLVDEAAQEEVVKNDKNLYAAVVKAYKELNEDQNITIISGNLSGEINRYLLTHDYKAPKSVVDLGQKLQKYAANRWGHVNPINLG